MGELRTPQMPLHSRTLLLHRNNITAIFPSVCSASHQLKLQPLIYLTSAAKPISRFSLYNHGSRSISHSLKPRVEYIDKNRGEEEDESRDYYCQLKQKLDEIGLGHYNSYTPGQYHLLFCPKCKGGRSTERTLSFHITQDKNLAIWRCFFGECGWAGQVFPDSWVNINFNNRFGKGHKLQPLGDELIAYFAGRMISKQTLERNYVMQIAGQKNVIAFTYRRDGIFVGCKYRTLEKKFWQEKGTEKILYGLDDIKEADEIIIVEGEMDKLSMEEAGISNCVSVPAGAPQAVSVKELPTLEKVHSNLSFTRDIFLTVKNSWQRTHIGSKKCIFDLIVTQA